MKKSSIELVVGVFVLIGLVCIAYLTIKLGKMEWMGENHYLLSARFDSVSGLRSGAGVELAGVEIGQVNSISLDTENMQALVQLKIQNDIKLSDDIIVSVKTAGLIGDKYINITPGGSDEMLKPGDTIIDTVSVLDIEELISKYVFGNLEK
jgi:phospholipid/cholesterol/gamma-HCH transport system substrate-binding protein